MSKTVKTVYKPLNQDVTPEQKKINEAFLTLYKHTVENDSDELTVKMNNGAGVLELNFKIVESSLNTKLN